MIEHLRLSLLFVGVIERYWTAIELRDWPRLAALLTDGVVYQLPQTRERICGRGDYVRFNAEFLGTGT
jgi:hypothetical protein